MNGSMSLLTTPVRSDNRNSGTDPEVQTQLALKIQKHILKKMLINCWSNLGWKT